MIFEEMAMPHAPQLHAALLTHRPSLVTDFCAGLAVVAHTVQVQAARNGVIQEPDMVAGLVLEGTQLFGRTLSRQLAPVGIQTRVAGIFCHNRPAVRYQDPAGGRPSCELGDLMIVHRHREDPQADPEHRALLLQAKWCNGASVTLKAGELVQLDLYRHWPRFTYFRSGPRLNGRERSVFPRRAHPGAQYLLFDKGLPHVMTVYPATGKMLYPHQPFAERLLDLLLAREGRAALPFPDCGDVDWSALVWDAVGFAKQAVFDRKNIGLKNVSRGVNLAFIGDPKWAYVSDYDGSEPSHEAKDENMSAFLEWLDGINPPLPPDATATTEVDEPIALPLLFIDTLGNADAAAPDADEDTIAGAGTPWPPVTQREAVEQYALRLITARHERARFAELFERFEHGPGLMRCLEAAAMLPENDRMKGVLQVAADLEQLRQEAESDDANEDSRVDCRAMIQARMVALL